MSNLKLVINNKSIKKENFFIKKELQSILNLYAKKSFFWVIGKIMVLQLTEERYLLMFTKEYRKNLCLEFQKF